MKKRVGILGFGSVGQFLVEQIQTNETIAPQLELAFVWNRSAERFVGSGLDEDLVFSGDLPEAWQQVQKRAIPVDLLIEVAHPIIVQEYGAELLQSCDLLVSSVTALADANTEETLRAAANPHGVYIPSGAGWGLADIAKMAAMNTLRGLRIKMAFGATALKLQEPLASSLQGYLDSTDTEPFTLYTGPVRPLAGLAPNNVNTMTAVALAGETIGLDKTEGTLVAQKNHTAHLVEIEIQGPDGFWVKTTRHNPAKKGAVTGAQTYFSFLFSLLQAGGQGPGWHFC